MMNEYFAPTADVYTYETDLLTDISGIPTPPEDLT